MQPGLTLSLIGIGKDVLVRVVDEEPADRLVAALLLLVVGSGSIIKISNERPIPSSASVFLKDVKQNTRTTPTPSTRH